MQTYYKELCKSHVNGATKLTFYSYIGIGKYLGMCQNISDRGGLGVQGRPPPNVNLGPPIISETTRARKLKLRTQLAIDKCLFPI